MRVLWLVLAAGCAPEAVGTLDVLAPTPAQTVRWSDDGMRLVLDGTVAMDPHSGRRWLETSPWLPLHLDETGAVEVLGPFGQRRQFASSLQRFDEVSAGGAQWLDLRRVLVSFYEGCCISKDRILDVVTGEWSGSPFVGDFSRVTVEPLGPDLFAVFSDAEGCASLAIADGSGRTLLEPLDLGCVRSVQVAHALDARHPEGDGAPHASTQVWLTSPCELEARGPFEGCPEDEGTVRLYQWSPEGLALVRVGLPLGTAVSPGGDRFAWPVGELVCVGDPDGASECF